MYKNTQFIIAVSYCSVIWILKQPFSYFLACSVKGTLYEYPVLYYSLPLQVPYPCSNADIPICVQFSDGDSAGYWHSSIWPPPLALSVLLHLPDLTLSREEEQFVFVLWPYGPISGVTTPQSHQEAQFHFWISVCVCTEWPWRPPRTLYTAPCGHLHKWCFLMRHLACDHCSDAGVYFISTYQGRHILYDVHRHMHEHQVGPRTQGQGSK